MSGKLFELELTGMAYGGSAVGRHEGRAIFVPYVLPGERIRARIKQDKKRFALAEAVKLLGVAADRVEPRCPHFGPGLCGGCHWQHIAYPAQLLFKQQIVADQLRRIGGLAEVVVQPIIPSPDPWDYRSHVTFQTTPAGRLGFVREDNAAVLALRECHLIRPELLELFNQHNGNVPENTARLRLQVGTDGAEHLAAITTPDEQMFGPVSANTMVHYTIREHTFQATAGSFFQVNLPQAETLVNLVLDRLGLTGTERVLDLYSGVGLFTAFLAERAAQVTAVESYPPAITDAEQNLAAFTNVELVEGAVETVLAALEGDYAAAVLDPPRAGVDAQALAALIKLAPQTIIYVSCDPSTLARDVKMLTQNGYEVLEIQPVDMFPQTYHIETVCWLKKNS